MLSIIFRTARQSLVMCNAGRSLLEVQAVLGHAHYSTTSRYARLSMTTLQEAANVASKKIGSATTSTTQQAAANSASIITKGATKVPVPA